MDDGRWMSGRPRMAGLLLKSILPSSLLGYVEGQITDATFKVLSVRSGVESSHMR